ncbi:MAG: hypothetical protein JO071_11970 [Deltaproteobacteria bacterium]|nr:hypothetical protein [Deltaproteobacteria bacterium]
MSRLTVFLSRLIGLFAILLAVSLATHKQATVDALGQGPMARALKTSPPDLRYLGERYGKPLPIGTIARFIDGREYVAAHGPRDMPVWGKRFYDVWTAKRSREGDLQVQIREIALYLNAIQK